jgi:hypothetical protein
MAAEAQRAPRVVGEQTSMAAAAAASSNAIRRSALVELTSFKLNGVLAFAGDPDDMEEEVLRQAHSLSVVLSNIVDDPASAERIRGLHLAGAIDAIGTLIALAAFRSPGVRP